MELANGTAVVEWSTTTMMGFRSILMGFRPLHDVQRHIDLYQY